jgi:hypothetical protein
MTQQSNGAALATIDDVQAAVFESLVVKGDISQLDSIQKAQYLEKLCSSLGLNPLTQPFVPLKLSGKEVLYASRGATDQLASINKITREIIKTERIEDVYVATCRASMPDGRFDISTGAVTIGGLKGDGLANALMKAETKAKRRATLSLCGLGFLDESEIETIPRERVEHIQERSATKGQLVEQAEAAAADADLVNYKTEISRLANAIGKDPAPTLKFIDQNPADAETAYKKVARTAINSVFDSDKWNRTEDGTAQFLEEHGITNPEEASRGQLDSVIRQFAKDGLLTLEF